MFTHLGSTHRWSQDLHTWLLEQQSRPQAIWLLRWQHNPVMLLPQNWLAVQATDGPQAELPGGRHMLLMHIMPLAQQPLLQNVSDGRQHTCRVKKVAGRQRWCSAA
jgi:hypothetical protein